MDDRPRYMISVAAELVGMHPQTLRIYEQKGLVRPQRTPGNTRLYSERDLERLRLIQGLTTELGLNLAGVEAVLALRDEVERLRRRVAALERRLREEVAAVHREYRRDLVLYTDQTTTLPALELPLPLVSMVAALVITVSFEDVSNTRPPTTLPFTMGPSVR